jgi:hypothetical protein
MATNQQWTDFISLVDIDAAKTDQLGQQARMLRTALEKYMEMRFNTDQVVYLADIIMSPAVVTAVVASLTHIAEDDAAVKAAVAAVLAG